jgi:hypothetical protein
MVEYEPILGFMSLQGNYLVWREKVEKIPVWRGKVGIVLILHGRRKL